MIAAICPNPSVDKIYELDGFVPGAVNRCNNVRAYPGGKGVHVGLALNELGSDTEIIAYWGGPSGKWIREKCLEKGVKCSGPVLEEWNRTCITFLSNGSFQNTEILETGPMVQTEHTVEFLNSVKTVCKISDAVCVSGSWPDGVPLDIFNQLQTICKFQETDLWVDASGEYLEAALAVKPFGIHLNRTEAEQVLNEKLNSAEMARKLLNYCNVVALTDGADGLYFGYGNTILHSTCAVDNVISTVGSGDCLTAGLLYSWYGGKTPAEAARIATACGAANCINPDLGMIRKEDVDNFIKQTIIKEI
ncbi:MAG: 1-phosphofructokinase [Balneolaceae bacterium]|nr:MAG: 1-phosphofructokinase [Balneolaceae bacterium]